MGDDILENLGEALKRSSKLDSGITFIYSETNEEYISYSELYDISLKVLGGLKRRGIKKGDEVIFQFTNNKDFIIVFWACMFGGIIPVPITIGNNEEIGIKILKIWLKLKNPIIVTSESNFFRVKELLENVVTNTNADLKIIDEIISISDFQYDVIGEAEKVVLNDIAYIQFSSGSTGDPKGVTLTHRNLLTNINDIIQGCEAIQQEKLLSWMPLTHDMGLIGMHITPLVLGMNQYNMKPVMFVKSPLMLLSKITEYKINIIASPNFGYSHILAKVDLDKSYDWDLSSVRVIFNGAEMISYENCNKFLDVMSKYSLSRQAMFNVYGMAEASLAVSFPKVSTGMKGVIVDRKSYNIGERVIERNEEDYDTSVFVEVGRPVNSCMIKIVDNEDKEIGDRIVGRIKIKGNNVTEGYYCKDELDTKIISYDGWLDTGDIGFFKEGNLVILGRIKDIIIVNGQNYYCTDLERIVEKFSPEKFKEIAVSGYLDEALNEKILVFIVYRKGDLEFFEDVVEKIRVGFYHEIGLVIDEVIPVKKVYKTTSGKVQHFRLIRDYKDGVFNEILEKQHKIRVDRFESREIDSPNNEIEKSVLEIFRNVLDLNKIGITDELVDYSLKSIQVMQIMDELDKIYPKRLNVSDLFRYNNIKEIAQAIDDDKRNKVIGNKYEGYVKKSNLQSFDEIEFELVSEMTKEISIFKEEEKVDFIEILMAIQLYINWELSQESLINIYVIMDDVEYANEISVNFNELDTVADLIKLIKRNDIGKKVDIKKLIRNTKENEISSLLYNGILLNRSMITDIDVFDVSLGFVDKKDSIIVSIRYDNEFKNDFINKYVNTFKKTLMNLKKFR